MKNGVRSLVLAGLAACLYASGAFAQTAADASAPDPRKVEAAQACADNLKALLDPSKPLSDQQQMAYANCYTSNGLPVPTMKKASVTKAQIDAFQKCVATHGGKLPKQSSDLQEQLTQDDFAIIRECNQSTGIDTPPVEDKAAAENAATAAVDACIQPILPDSLTGDDRKNAMAKLTPDQRAAIQRCYTSNNVPPLMKQTPDQVKSVQSCMDAHSAYGTPTVGNDDKTIFMGCLQQAGVDVSAADIPPALPPLDKMPPAVKQCVATRTGQANPTDSSVPSNVIQDCMKSAGVKMNAPAAGN